MSKQLHNKEVKVLTLAELNSEKERCEDYLAEFEDTVLARKIRRRLNDINRRLQREFKGSTD